jgi:protein-tyrosine-phosphatase
MAAELIDEADLVLAMERRHVQEAVLLAADAEARTFTLRDLAARSDASPPRGARESVREWAARLSADRPRSALLGVGSDGVNDPIGGPRAQYARTAEEIDELLSRVVAAAFPNEVAA